MYRMKKILYVITKSNFGGAQRYVYELATKLDNEHFSTEVALGGDGLLKSKLLEAGIPVHQIAGASRDVDIFKEMKVLWSLYSIFRKVKPDIVHLNSSKIGGLGAVAARLAGVNNIIFTNHGWAFKEQRPALQNALIKFLSWVTVLATDTTIVLSERERIQASSWPFVGKRLRVIPNGLVPFEFLPKDEALLKLVGKETQERIKAENIKVVGTIAELTNNKGLIYAIEGFALLKDTQTIFIIIGEGEERNKLEEAVASRDLGDIVFFAGAQDNARTYLKAFDFFILPSVKEGLPYAILEAGYAELPVIATHVGGIPEIITNLEDGLLISPRRPQEIKHALIYVKNHPEDIKNFASNLHKKIHTFYNFDRMLRSTTDLYTRE
jgi:glycosyltransferase involved in cell wall biosynthesis